MNEEENRLEHFGSNDKSNTDFDTSAVIAQAESDKIAQNESRVESSDDAFGSDDVESKKSLDNPLADASNDDMGTTKSAEKPAEQPAVASESVDDIFAKAATELPDLPTDLTAEEDSAKETEEKLDVDSSLDEEKTERESLEDAIEQLNQESDAAPIDELGLDKKNDMASEMRKELDAVDAKDDNNENAAAGSTENAWKLNQAATNKKEPSMDNFDNASNMTAGSKEKKKCGVGIKIFAFLMTVLAILGCGATAYLMFSDGKTEILGRSVVSSKMGDKKEKQAAPSDNKNSQEVPVPVDSANTFQNIKIDYRSIATLEGQGADVSPRNIEIDDKGEYVVVVADIAMGEGGYAGVWYKRLESGATWQRLLSGQDAVQCSSLTDEQRELVKRFDNLDDMLDSQYITCEE